MGVEVLWTDAPATNAHGRFVIHLIIRPKASRPRMMGNALGDSHGTGGTAFVYRDRVLDVARARDLEVARVLAYAMAHEMGHLLLPYPSHAITGIMQADWDGARFRATWPPVRCLYTGRGERDSCQGPTDWRRRR